MVQLGITLKNAVGTTNAYSQDAEDGLLQFFSSSGLGRQLLHSIYTRVNGGADKQRLNQLLRWHSDAQCSPEEAVTLLLDLGIPRRRLRVLSRFISKRAEVWYKQTGLRFGKPMPVVARRPVCAFVNAASLSSKNIFVRTFEGLFETKSSTFRKHIFRAFRWLQAESKEPNPQEQLC